MKGKSIWKKAAVFAAIVFALWIVYPGLYRESDAQTDLSMDEFEDVIGSYNIDDSVPSYKNYVAQHAEAAYPDVQVEIGTEHCVRYEEDGKAKEAAVYKDYEGIQGSSLLTTEDSLIWMSLKMSLEAITLTTLFQAIKIMWRSMPKLLIRMCR